MTYNVFGGTLNLTLSIYPNVVGNHLFKIATLQRRRQCIVEDHPVCQLQSVCHWRVISVSCVLVLVMLQRFEVLPAFEFFFSVQTFVLIVFIKVSLKVLLK